MDCRVVEGSFYDRDDSLAQLNEAYERCLHANEERELVLITGPSGGKSVNSSIISSRRTSQSIASRFFPCRSWKDSACINVKRARFNG
jgi:hypothetical protein